MIQLNLGDSGKGTLNVTNGAYVHTAGLHAGYNATGTGNATVDGAGSKWDCLGYIYLGYNGTGTIKVTNGGTLTTVGYPYNFYMGMDPTGVGTILVDGAGSTWNNTVTYQDNSTFIDIGGDGAGLVKITNGGHFHGTCPAHISAPISAGGTTTGTGVVLVDGSGSTWTNDYLIGVGTGNPYNGGLQGHGTLNVRGGGAVTATDVSVNTTSLVSIDVGTGSSLAASGALNGTGGGTVRVVAGASPTGGSTYTPITAATWRHRDAIRPSAERGTPRPAAAAPRVHRFQRHHRRGRIARFDRPGSATSGC